MDGAGHPKPELCDDLEGWGGQRGGGGFPREGAHVCLWPILLMYGKHYRNIVKQLSFSENKSTVF